MRKPQTPALDEMIGLIEEPNTKGGSDRIEWTKVPNLYVQIRCNGKTWMLRWRDHGRSAAASA